MAYPTDTLYGLGADASSSLAVEQIARLKGRSGTPISVMLGSVEWLLDVAKSLSENAVKLIHAFLPGSLTVICDTDLVVAESIRSEKGSVGFRIPDHSLCLEIVQQFGKPITSTSVNPTGAVPARSVEQIVAYFDDRLDLVIDAGTLPPSPGSTVIDLCGERPNILREGVITREAIRKALD